MTTEAAERIEFKAEIQQLLDILVHALYSEQEVFLRELISNASDALHRVKLETLKQQRVLDAGAELGIWLEGDPDARTLTIRDSGIGMTQEELVRYLGTIAHSGAKAFIEAMTSLNQGSRQSATEVIGQFGVGFYSVFMVAEAVTVTSRSFDPEAQAAFWRSSGQGSYEVGPAAKAERGTVIEIKLKEEAKEFAESYRLRQIIKTHSDFVAFPIYLKEDGAFKQVNAQTALWRERPQSVSSEQHKHFYQQLTFDVQAPLLTVHFAADMPIQFYALLYVPSRRDYKLFRDAEDYGLKLYARKVLIKDNYRELLPPYLRFIEGVVDSEDLPLNVSREMVQATPLIARIRKALVGRIASELNALAHDDPERYATFYREFGHFLKEGVATDPSSHEKFVDLLRFTTSKTEPGQLTALKDYLERMPEGQAVIYYMLGDDLGVISRSSHLEYFRKHDTEVLLLTDPIDSFMLMGLSEYQGKKLQNIDDADLQLPSDSKLEIPVDEDFISLSAFIKRHLGDKVAGVRESKVLSDSAARLVNPAGGNASFYRVQRLMGREVEIPKKILELNPKSPIIQSLAARLHANDKDPLLPLLVEQLYENELLAEGLHPNPAEMLPRLQRLMAEVSKPTERD
jgi:molecular chaperone HtpG